FAAGADRHSGALVAGDLAFAEAAFAAFKDMNAAALVVADFAADECPLPSLAYGHSGRAVAGYAAILEFAAAIVVDENPGIGAAEPGAGSQHRPGAAVDRHTGHRTRTDQAFLQRRLAPAEIEGIAVFLLLGGPATKSQATNQHGLVGGDFQAMGVVCRDHY